MTMTTKEKLESKSSHNRNRLRASLREKEAIIACIYMCVCVRKRHRDAKHIERFYRNKRKSMLACM
jgi:hypothetical protein